MTDKQIVDAAKASEKETEFGELVYSQVSRGVNSAYGIGFLEGAEWAREQMMKEAVEGEVCIPNVWVDHKEGKELVVRTEISKELGFKFGDKRYDAGMSKENGDTPFLDIWVRKNRQYKKDIKIVTVPNWVSREEFFATDDPFVRLLFSFGNDCRTYIYAEGEKNELYKRALHYAICFRDYKPMIDLGGPDLSPIDSCKTMHGRRIKAYQILGGKHGWCSARKSSRRCTARP